MEYALVALVVVAGVSTAFTAAGPTIQGVMRDTLSHISGLVSAAVAAAGG